MTVLPYKKEKQGKKEQVARMFNNISGKYDFLNHFLSMGIDRRWRKKVIRELKKNKAENVLDVATGTGDFALEALKLNPKKITGVDISEGMLEEGRKKIAKKNLSSKIELKYGDSENLEFPDGHFDIITVGFGVRNFENLEKGLLEMKRVLKSGGTLAILEFSKPKNYLIKQFYNFYFKSILPFFGKIISKDKSAYTYLPESVQAFPEGDEFKEILLDNGYFSVKYRALTFRIATVYFATK